MIYNGIDTATFRPLPQREGRERRLLFVGGSNPRKGIDVLLDAFALVSNHYLACGVPVISTEMSSIIEIVEDGVS